MKAKVIATILLMFVFAFRLWQTTGCVHFNGFYFNPLSVKIDVESQRNTDVGTNQTAGKIIHNKLSAGIFEVGKDYSQEFGTNYLLEILGPIGFVLFITAIFKLIKQRSRIQTLHLLLVLAAAAVGLTTIDPKTSFYLLTISLYSFSIWGIGAIANKRFKFSIFLILIFASVIYFMFNWQLQIACHEIFFK